MKYVKITATTTDPAGLSIEQVSEKPWEEIAKILDCAGWDIFNWIDESYECDCEKAESEKEALERFFTGDIVDLSYDNGARESEYIAFGGCARDTFCGGKRHYSIEYHREELYVCNPVCEVIEWFEMGEPESECTQPNIKTILADLTAWARAYPTGAIAYDSNDSVIDSAYCDDAEEFADFFDAHREEINSDTELVFKISAGDFDILELEKLVYSIRDAFWKILEGGNNNEI